MKMNRTLLTLSAIVFLCWLPTFSRAQYHTENSTPSTPSDKDQSADTSDTDTNMPMKKLMLKADQVTNTVDIVLKKISPTVWVGIYEVTQQSYKKVAGANPSAFQGNDHPVDSVTWNEAMDFCKKLTQQEQKADQLPDGYIYTLPTQSQWENFVADASLSDAIMSMSWPHRYSTAPVGSRGPNSLGLYDTRGNVKEWCLDPLDKPYRVLRGGGYDTYIEINTRLEFREYSAPDKTKKDYGFRVVLEPQGTQ